MKYVLCCAIVGVLAAPLIACPQNSASEDSHLIAGLRQRQLFDLAESYCQKQLLNADGLPAEQSTFVIELMKTQTARTLLADFKNREAGWERVHQTAQTFLERHPGHPRALLIQVQQELARLSQGKALRQELEAEMIAPDKVTAARDRALQQLRLAQTGLSAIGRDVQDRIPEHRTRALRPGELGPEELMALSHRIGYQLAILHVNQARLFPAGDRLNRIDALHQVLGQIEQVQRETTAGQPLWWDTRILKIECLYLLGEVQRASELADSLARLTIGGEMQPRLWEQQLRLAMASENPSKTKQLLRVSGATPDPSPALMLAQLEAMSWLAALPKQSEQEPWLEQAVQLSQQVAVRHGWYWGRRARLVLIGAGQATGISDDRGNPDLTNEPAVSARLDLLLELAEQAFRNGRLEDARKAYVQAGGLAHQLRQAQQVFALGIQEAKILELQKLPSRAADRLMQLGMDHMDLESSSAAHLRGCWNLAQVVDAGADRQPGFVTALQEHLKHWPEKASANQARLWLAGQYQSGGDWKSAFENYRQVSVDSPLFAEAFPRANYCARQWLQTELASDSTKTAERILAWFKSTTESMDIKSKTYPEVLLAHLEFAISHETVDPQAWLARLEKVQVGESEQRFHAAWLALLTFDASQLNNFDRKLNGLKDHHDSLAFADKAIAEVVRRNPKVFPGVDACRMKIVEAALLLDLTDEQSATWRLRKAEQLIAAHDYASAYKIVRDVQKQIPGNRSVSKELTRLALLLSEKIGADDRLKLWRRLLGACPPHSESWYSAKYHIASGLAESGKKNDARKMLEYLKTVPPGWKDSSRAAQFEKLLQQCR